MVFDAIFYNQKKDYKLNNNTNEKLCIVCGKKIPVSAKKCTECNSFQNWRRYIHFSSTVLALIVALISVLTASVPILKETLKSDNSQITILPQTYDENKKEYIFIVANSGTKAGGISAGYFVIPPSIVNNMFFQIVFSFPGIKVIDLAIAFPLTLEKVTLSEVGTIAPFYQSGETGQLLVKYNLGKPFFIKFNKPIYNTLESSVNQELLRHYDPSVTRELHDADTREFLARIAEYKEKCKITFKVINFNGIKDQIDYEVGCDVLVLE